MNFNSLFEKKLFDEINFSNFKKKCVACGTAMQVTQESYYTRGNYCSDCNVKAGKTALKEYKNNKKFFNLCDAK